MHERGVGEVRADGSHRVEADALEHLPGVERDEQREVGHEPGAEEILPQLLAVRLLRVIGPAEHHEQTIPRLLELFRDADVDPHQLDLQQRLQRREAPELFA